MTWWEQLWQAVNRPSGAEVGPYWWAVIALGHVMLGAVLVAVLLGLDVGRWWALLLIPAYWLIKELSDLLRGGDWRDGLVDAGFVALGVAYNGDWWWPVAVWSVLAAGIAIKWRRNDPK